MSVTAKLDMPELIRRKIDELVQAGSVQEIRIAAHKQINFDLLKKIAIELEEYKTKRGIKINTELGEKKR